jgi:hypothetical protein
VQAVKRSKRLEEIIWHGDRHSILGRERTGIFGGGEAVQTPA